MTKITFLGLGVMGYPMAGHLAGAGHEVTVYNRTAAKASRLDVGAWRRNWRNPGGRRSGCGNGHGLRWQ